ncbi:MAG TPA: hydroxysqualene dehydroxylase HpnE [Acidimicrobiales bacterium]|nr:hydroxysqualene dehydroxylase HpnE [Acidimicrobiales bacterium]
MTRPRICVVGGGLAGMAAALACADAGAEVTLVERRRRLGGATWSFRHNDLWFDNGQHVFLRCCTAYRAFLDRLGVADLVRLQSRLDVPVIAPGGRTSRLRRSRWLPAPAHLGRSLLTYGHLGARDRLRLAPAALALRRVDIDAAETDRQTFGRWLSRHGQSPEARDALWDLICRPTVNLPADEASLALAAMVFRTGLLSAAGAADIGWASVPLGELHGDAGLRALERAGVEVLTGVPAAVGLPADGATGFTVRIADTRRVADAVVVAVPHTAVADVAPGLDGLRGVAERLGVSPIVNVHVVYDRPVTDLEFAAGVGTDVQFVFDRTAAAGLERGQYLAVSLSAADPYMDRSSDEVKAAVVAGLADLFPRARSARVVDALVSREPAATFRGAPGSAAARPGSTTAIPGLVLAGAWTATGWPATMEGAVRSGNTAARHALLAAGHTRHPARPVDEEVVA